MIVPLFLFAFAVSSYTGESSNKCPKSACPKNALISGTLSDSQYCNCRERESENFAITFDADVGTKIPKYFFYNSKFASVVITAKISTIDTGAFERCEIETVSFGDPEADSLQISAGAFYNAKISNALTLPKKLTTIKESSFDSYERLSIDFATGFSPRTIENFAFRHAKFQSNLIIHNDLTTIGSSAFQNVDFNYNSINLGSLGNLETIQSFAFSDCTENAPIIKLPSKLKTVGTSAFYEYGGSISLDKDLKLTSVGSFAFYGVSLSSSTAFPIPKDVTKIESYAFAKISGLYFPKFIEFTKLAEIGNGAFQDTTFSNNNVNIIELPPTLKIVGANAFSGDQKTIFLTKTKLESVGDEAFKGQKINESFSLSENLREVGDSAFEPPSNEQIEITLEGCDKLRRIGDNAFRKCITDSEGNPDCESMKRKIYVPDSISFPEELTYIGDNAFKGTTLSMVTFNSKSILEVIGESAFEDLDRLIVNGPINAEEIKENAFSGCSNMNTQIEIQGSGQIGSKAFFNCYLLEGPLTVKPQSKFDDYPDNTEPIYTTIGAHAFENTAIKSLDLPHVEEISEHAFKDCFKLESIKSNVLDAETISGNAFENDFNLKISNITATTISASAFERCSKLGADIYILSAGTIGSKSFQKCTSLGTLTFHPPDDLTDRTVDQSVGSYAFDQSGLKGPLVLHEKVIKIDKYAFANCPNLDKVTITLDPFEQQTIDSYAFYRSKLSEDLVIPSSVKQINGYAFAHCQFRTLTIQGTKDDHDSSKKTTIAKDAFYSCTNLNTLNLKEGVIDFHSDSFKGCNIGTLNLGNITSIPTEAFYGMTSLTTAVSIPDSVTSVGSRAFAYCTGIRSITFGERSECTSLGNGIFSNCKNLETTSLPKITSESTPVKLPQNTFYLCSSLKSIEIPPTYTEIEKYAFYKCSSLGQISFPGELTKIGISAFQGCIALTGTLNFPETMTTVDKQAFMGCTSLKGSIKFGRSMTTINEDAFNGCSELDGTLTFTENLDGSTKLKVKDRAFYGCSKLTGDLTLYENWVFEGGAKDVFHGCSGLNGVLTISDELKSIPEGTFYGCSQLTGQIPTQYLTSIGPYAFYDCSSLSGPLDIQSLSKQEISKYAFYNCRGLNDTLLTKPLTKVEKYAFYGCSGLKGSLDCSKLGTVEQYAFSGCSGLSGPLLFEGPTLIEEYAFNDCSGFSDRLTFRVETLDIREHAFKGCSGFKKGVLTFTIETNEESADYFKDNKLYQPYYKYDYFLTIGNKAFEDCKFKDVYYLGRFEPDCDYDIGISQIKGIHTSSNYANKTFCNYPLHKSKLSGGAIAGIVIAVVVVVAVIVFLIIYFIIRNKRNKDNSEAEVEMNQDP